MKLLFTSMILVFSLFSNNIKAQESKNNLCINDHVTAKIQHKNLNLDVACSNEKLSKGLMFVDGMDYDKGMIFVFDDEKIRTFWMKNTKIPLDILFIDKNMNIISIQTMKPYDLTPVSSISKAMYAIEVNAGYVKENNIKNGDKVIILK